MRRTEVSLPADEQRALPAEIVFLIVVLCLSLFFTLAGIPGAPLPEAGDGSEALRQGWSERQGAPAEVPDGGR